MLGSTYISTKLIDTVAKENEEIRENKEVYIYCIDFLLEQFFFILSLLLIGLCIQDIGFGLLFYAIFILARATGGGIHASTPLRCTVISYLVFDITYTLVCIMPDNFDCLWLYIYFLIVTVHAAFPVIDHKNKRFTKAHKKKLKKRKLLFLIGLTILYIIFYYTNLSVYYKLITVSSFLFLMSEVLGYIRNRCDGEVQS